MAFDGFSLGLIIWFAIFVVLYGATFGYQLPNVGINVVPANQYKLFSNIHIMAYMGFGTLMSFNARLGMTATATSLVLAAVAALWYMLNRGLWEQAIGRERPLVTARLGQDQIVRADFAVSSMLIAFGAVIGRITPLQGLILVITHVLFYSINESLGEQRLKINDVGGAMTIHMFGGFFGLAASFVLDRSEARRSIVWEACTTSTSIVRSLIGTLFLFVFWPSFNCYFAAARSPLEVVAGIYTLNDIATPTCVANTYLALTMGALVAVVLSRLFNGTKTLVADVQNSVFAGGIAIAAVSNNLVTPFGAIVIGAAGAFVSVVGINYISPFLERAAGIRDTCTVFSLHGITGLFGGFVSIIVAGSAVLTSYTYPYEAFPGLSMNRPQSQVAAFQIGYIVLTFAMATFGGIVAGILMRFAPNPTRFGTDIDQWGVSDAQGEYIME